MALDLSTGLKNAILQASGTSFADSLAYGTIWIYEGTRPTSADDSEGSSVVLVKITVDSLTLTPGTDTNGINLDVAADGVVSKSTSETWSGQGITAGTAQWFRYYDNDVVTGASTTALRFDGSIATSGSDMDMAVRAISVGGTTTIDAADFELP